MPYLSNSAIVIHFKEALYQVYAPFSLPLVVFAFRRQFTNRLVNLTVLFHLKLTTVRVRLAPR